MAYTGDAKREYQRIWKNNRRLAWIESKGGRCVKCGSDDRIEIDHKDPAMKEAHVSRLWSCSREVREPELAKCQLLCHECHLTKTHGRDLPIPHGTHPGYRRHKCRCEECRGANAAQARADRLIRRLRAAA